jgi:hypothetical protein
MIVSVPVCISQIVLSSYMAVSDGFEQDENEYAIKVANSIFGDNLLNMLSERFSNWW